MSRAKTKRRCAKRANKLSSWYTNDPKYLHKQNRSSSHNKNSTFIAKDPSVFSIVICEGYSVDIHNLWADRNKVSFKHVLFSHKKRMSVIAELLGL